MADLPFILQQRQPVRILVIAYSTSQILFEHHHSCVNTIINHLNADPNNSKLLVIQRWPSRTLIVFDLYHTDYDNRSAHNIEDIPVVTVQVRTDTRFQVKQADEMVTQEINSQVAECHNLHGFGVTLPLVEDHRNGNVPDYPNPRRLVED